MFVRRGCGECGVEGRRICCECIEGLECFIELAEAAERDGVLGAGLMQPRVAGIGLDERGTRRGGFGVFTLPEQQCDAIERREAGTLIAARSSSNLFEVGRGVARASLRGSDRRQVSQCMLPESRRGDVGFEGERAFKRLPRFFCPREFDESLSSLESGVDRGIGR